ncbi:hypothetical protein GCM10009535_38380 [Streptomyces thermocarboxydovorans]|uniref:Uncharacterized protein n=1 Tax=Streptomyces thermocarboxydovorans TaxID=59298 RepID=A0ABP3SNL0_9ACTN
MFLQSRGGIPQAARRVVHDRRLHLRPYGVGEVRLGLQRLSGRGGHPGQALLRGEFAGQGRAEGRE